MSSGVLFQKWGTKDLEMCSWMSQSYSANIFFYHVKNSWKDGCAVLFLDEPVIFCKYPFYSCEKFMQRWVRSSAGHLQKVICRASAERVQLVPIYWRYKSQRYFSSQSRYIADILYKDIFQDVEHLWKQDS